MIKNKIHDLVRLAFDTTLSARQVAASLDVSKSTVARYRQIIANKSLTYEALRKLSNSSLSAKFNRLRRQSKRPMPDWQAVTKAMEDPSMTLYRVWHRYNDEESDALSYPQFTRLYRAHSGPQKLSLRQRYNPGEKVYVDFSGRRPSFVHPTTGDAVPVELFVATLAHSHLTFVYATASQSVPDWLEAHTKMLDYFGGVPHAIVPDNLKAAVVKPGKEPEIQQHYLEFARHYGTAILAARPGHPRDKGVVEGAVRIVQQQMLPDLAQRKFFSVAEINEALRPMLDAYNKRPFQKREGSRRSQFEDVERAQLLPLPKTAFRYSRWLPEQKVPLDYHVAIDGHYYSVPHALVGKGVQPRVCGTHVEVHHDGLRVARHARGTLKGGHTTELGHQPEAHRAMGERTPSHLLAWAEKVGPHIKEVMHAQFRQKVPLQGLPSALALRAFEKSSTPQDLEWAASHAVRRRTPSVTDIRRLLSNRSLIASPPADGFSRPTPARAAGRSSGAAVKRVSLSLKPTRSTKKGARP